MAPGRRRGENKSKLKRVFSLGDLVLAKVKGFPAWPAKISKPEDWNQIHDPKKQFVYFFGTHEIAFVAPAEIQEFTDDVKTKLSVRCQGKTVKYFAQAVREICEAFEEIHKKTYSESRVNAAKLEDTDVTDRLNEESAIDGVVDGVSLEKFEIIEEDVKHDISQNVNITHSPVILSNQKKKALNDNSVQLPNTEVVSTSFPAIPSHIKEQISGDKDQKKVGHSEALTNGHKSDKVVDGTKRKCGNAVHNSCSPTLSLPNGYDSKDHSIDVKNGNSNSDFFLDGLKLDSDVSIKVKTKQILKAKNPSEIVDGSWGGDAVDSNKLDKKQLSGTKKKVRQVANVKRTLVDSKVLHSAKRLKSSSMERDVNERSLQKEENNDSFNVGDVSTSKSDKHAAFRSSMSQMNSEGHSTLVGGSGNACDEAVFLLSKRHRRAFDSNKIISEEKTKIKPAMIKNTISSSQYDKSSATQLHVKGWDVCIDDSDDEDKPKTIVHRETVHNANVSVNIADTVTSIDHHNVGFNSTVESVQRLDRDEDSHFNEFLTSVNSLECNQSFSLSLQKTIEKRPKKIAAEDVSPTLEKLKSVKSCTKKVKSVTFPPKNPSLSIVLAMPSTRAQDKPIKFPVMISSFGSLKKASTSSGKGSGLPCVSLNPTRNQTAIKKNKVISSAERVQATPKPNARMKETPILTDHSFANNYFLRERSEYDITSLSIDTKTSDPARSMKHLIAAAQAKRKQAQSQNILYANINHTFGFSTDDQRSPITTHEINPCLSTTSDLMLEDVQKLHSISTTATSPFVCGRQLALQSHPDVEEFDNRKASSACQDASISLTGGTEADVARDAFEGMIETLSRTKESIGRATRLAIECANFGIANEVVELLISKLESEPSFYRKVDLFFLIDSITQCSRTRKGIAGSSYIPTIQETLPRLIGAAAPPGSSARENRRQCHKVLRLWLERKIFPESLIRRCMDQIGVSNEDLSVGVSYRRPSRSERAVDDPIREMEGMLVDEYGSNATFQLPGLLLSSHVFVVEEEDDLPSKEAPDTSLENPSHSLGNQETPIDTPNDKRHCILEDVDGELEMEDVSEHTKDEKLLFIKDSLGIESKNQDGDTKLNSDSNYFVHSSPILEGFSPPLPTDFPPSLPPLPPYPPSPNTLTPPLPSLSPPPPPPLPLQPPPPPLSLPLSLPLLLQPPLIPHLPPSDPLPPQLFSQPSLPLPPLMAPYQPPALNGYQCTSRGNELVNIMGNPSHSLHMKSLEYGHSDPYLNPQTHQSMHQFQTENTSYAQRTFLPVPPQTPSSHFSYPILPPQQHTPCSYPHQYPIPPDGQRRYGPDEHWRLSSNDLAAYTQRGMWMNGGSFLPPVERPPNNMGFQLSASNTLPTVAQIPGHGVSQMLPCRPDISAHNCWRPPNS